MENKSPAIITKLPTYTDGEIDRAFMREIKNGFKLEKATEEGRYNQAAKEADAQRGKTHPTLGKCVANIPHRDYFRMIHKYGHEAVHSPEFLRDLKKFEPALCANSA